MKKIVSLLLIVVMLMCATLLCACASNDTDTDDTDTNNNYEPNTPQTPNEENKKPNSNNNETNGKKCTSHKYENNICTQCNCSRWNGELSTAWYSAVENELVITKAEELAGIAQLVKSGTNFNGVTVKLGADIDLDNKEWTPIGDYNSNDKIAFEGTFDGSGHTITNLKMTSTDNAYIGLFGYAAGHIKNINLTNININLDGTDYLGIGTLVGRCYADVTDCSASGKITTKISSDCDIGGLIGYLHSYTTAKNSHSDVKINAATLSTGEKEYFTLNIGGLIGHLYGSDSVIKCFSNGDITATANEAFGYYTVGGLIGTIKQNTAITIQQCYATSSIEFTADGDKSKESPYNCTGNLGGLLGSTVGSQTTVTQCYASGNITASNKYHMWNESPKSSLISGALIAKIDSYSSVNNCFAIGNITLLSDGKANANHCSEYSKNSFYYSGQTIVANDISNGGASAVPNLTDFYGSALYNNRLKWDSSAWNYKNGDLPTLK